MSQDASGSAPKTSFRFATTLYFLHLLAPVAIAGVCAVLWYRRHSNRGAAFGLLLGALWIAVALVSWLASSDRNAFLKRLRIPLVAFCAILGLLAGAEFVLRLFPQELYRRRPGTTVVFETDEQVKPGIRTGKKFFRVNNVGLRGPDWHPHDNSYKVVVTGSQEAESEYLDDSQDLGHLLMADFNAQSKGTLWAASVAIGHNTRDHLTILDTLPVFRRVQMLVFLIGTADLQDTLSREGATTDGALEASARNYLNWLRTPSNTLARLALYNFLASAIIPKLPPKKGWNYDEFLVKQRKLRQQSRILPLPDLQAGISEYRKGILALSVECRKLDLRCLFLTEPTMWRDNLNQREQELVWMGAIGRTESPRGYASIGDLAQAMSQYNQTLLDTCSGQGLECYDLAAHVPKDTSAMFDDCHFNEGGARLVASLLSSYLASHPPALSAAPR
jgi:hypothetical protein